MDDAIGDIRVINRLMSIINAVFPSWKTEAIMHYIRIDTDITSFKQIELFSTSEFWSESEIPLINEKIKQLEELKYLIEGIDYLEHIVYLEERIQAMRDYKSRVEVQEYLWDEMA